MCARCGYGIESPDHLFAACMLARSVWWHVFVWVRVPMPPNLNTTKEIIEVLTSSPGAKRWKRLVRLAAMATIWRIWDARNKKVLEGTTTSIQKTVDLIKEDTFSWVSHRSSIPTPTWDDWLSFNVFVDLDA
ncbi:hypothetical protein HanPI659440_Chr01g0004851 [Helianthus annuus]|nr:hypothetical protein HanPI659440_Chr01g0004851 [Helianthus annuus]